MHDGVGHPAVAAHGLGVAYGERPALREVTFTVEPGELVALVGPNGAGKTTLLRSLMGLVPRTGTVVVHGRRPRAAAFVAQRSETDLDFPATVLQLVLTGRRALRGPLRRPGRADGQAARRALARVGIDGLEQRGLREVSGGQLQRALLARALVQEADVLLLDEPLTGLDPPTTESICDLLERLAHEGRTIIASTHDLPLVRTRFARCLAVNGRLVADGPPREVLSPEGLEALLL
jgi:ABC-type Mn2+/Zn2+ transport system ATPase subunit